MNKLGLLNNLMSQNAFFSAQQQNDLFATLNNTDDNNNINNCGINFAANNNNGGVSDMNGEFAFDTNTLINQLKLNLLTRQQQQQQQQAVDLNNNLVSYQSHQQPQHQAIVGNNCKPGQLNHSQQQHQELVKKILEKSRMQEQQQLLQQQQMKLINGHLNEQHQQQQQIQQQLDQQSKQEKISKEYILSQLRAQQKQQEQAKQHQQQQLQQEVIKQQLQQQELLLKQQQQQELLRQLKHKELLKHQQQQQQMLLQQQLLESNLMSSSKAIMHDLVIKDKSRLNGNQINGQRVPTPIGTKSPTPPSSSLHSSSSSPNPMSSSSSSSSWSSSSPHGGSIEMNHVDGNVKNVPPTMMLDQFGMLGLLMMLKQGQGGVSSRGAALPNNLYSMDEFYAEASNRLIEPCDQIPAEYKIGCGNGGGAQSFVKDKLGSDLTHVFQNSNIDLLFYMFYNCCKSELQLRAHDMLVSRGWCYDAKFKVWLKSVDAAAVMRATAGVDLSSACSGQLYDLFDPNSWSIRRVDLADLARAAAVTTERRH